MLHGHRKTLQQLQSPAEWQQSKAGAESSTEAPALPYLYVKEVEPKRSDKVVEGKDATEMEMVPEGDPQGELRVIQGN